MRALWFAMHCIAVGIIMFMLTLLSFALADMWRPEAATPAAQRTKPINI